MPSIETCKMNVRGKISRVSSNGEGNKKQYFHEMVIAGKDEFDSTSGIIVTSSRMIGAEGDVKEIVVLYSGYIKSNKYTDKNTGEQKEFRNLQARFKENVVN